MFKRQVSMNFVEVLFVTLALALGTYGNISWWVLPLSFLIAAVLLSFRSIKPENADSTKNVNSTQSYYQQTAADINKASSTIAIGGASVSHFLDKLSSAFKQQVVSTEDIAARIEKIELGNHELLDQTGIAETKINDSNERIQQSSALLKQLLDTQNALGCRVLEGQTRLNELQVSATSIASIINTINQLADQTNMLALNAAIEAARAGEQGKGFAVVADEVRELARKTTQATQDIDKVLSDVRSASEDSATIINEAVDTSNAMTEIVQQTAALIDTTGESSTDAKQAMSEVRSNVISHRETNKGISSNTKMLYEATKQLNNDLLEVSEQAISLSYQTEDVFRMLDIFDIQDTRNTLVQNQAIKAAQQISELFEQAVSDGSLRHDALFDFNYQPVANTNPQKYHTAFDAFTDKHLPPIQEPILQQHKFIIFAGAVDKNGYFPTHNKKYSAPMTGDYEKDLVNSRTKRIFNDRTGSRCGKNTEKFLLQTYKRDTGEVMHDLSAPIFINGKHWGGFRIGYKAE